MARKPPKTIGERIAYPFLRSAVRLGKATREIGEALRRAGVAVEASAIRDIEHSIRESEEASRRVLGVDHHELPDPDDIPEALTKMRRKYSYTFRGEYLTELGARISRYINVSTDRLLTQSQAEEAAQRILQDDTPSGQARSVITLEVIELKKAGPLGTL